MEPKLPKKIRRIYDHTRSLVKLDKPLMIKALTSLYNHEPNQASIITAIIQFTDLITFAKPITSIIPMAHPLPSKYILIVDKYKEWKQAELPCISHIMSIQRLREKEIDFTKYKIIILESIEARVKNILGKEKYKEIMPIVAKDITDVNKVVISSILVLNNGSEFSLPIGVRSMSMDSIIDNISSIYDVIVAIIQGQRGKHINVDKILVKGESTIKLPIYTGSK